MKVGYFALAAISAIVFCGCSRDESASTPSPSGEDYVFNLPEGDLTELNERIDVPADGKKLRIDEMSPDDVIVCVNGYPLTKKLQKLMLCFLIQIRRRHMIHMVMLHLIQIQLLVLHQALVALTLALWTFLIYLKIYLAALLVEVSVDFHLMAEEEVQGQDKAIV